jgi:hypothetical protein
LAAHINRDAYTKLPREQLARLPHWLATASQLGLDSVHARVLWCLQENMLRAVATTATIMNGSTIYCKPDDSSDLGIFQLMWTAGEDSTFFAASKQLDAVLAKLSGADKDRLLRTLVLPACFNMGLRDPEAEKLTRAAPQYRGVFRMWDDLH